MTGLLDLAWSQRRALLAATASHLDLIVEALALAVALGVPLGILATRSRAAERTVVGLANVLQTVPSLALLGFLLSVFGGQVGKPPAPRRWSSTRCCRSSRTRSSASGASTGAWPRPRSGWA